MFARSYGTSGSVVLVLHGGPAAVGDVAPIANTLASSFRVIEPWQRGSSDEPLTVARHVADLQELVTSTRDDAPPALVGHSWGAMLALCYAAKYPTMAGPIVLIGCGTFDKVATYCLRTTIEKRMDDNLRDRLLRLSVEATDPAIRFIQEFKLTRHLFDFDPIGAYADPAEFEPFDLQAHQETWSDLSKLRDAGIYPAAFSAIESPVLMLHGQYDPHPGEMIRDSLRPHIPHLEYCELTHCGHSPWIEKSANEQFFSTMNEWLVRRTS